MRVIMLRLQNTEIDFCSTPLYLEFNNHVQYFQHKDRHASLQ